MANITNVRTLGFAKGTFIDAKAGFKDVDRILPVFTRFADFLNIPYFNACCSTDTADKQLPTSYNSTTEELTYFDPITNTWVEITLGAAATPNLQAVVTEGNTADSDIVVANSSSTDLGFKIQPVGSAIPVAELKGNSITGGMLQLADGGDDFRLSILPANLTGNRTLTLPNTTGTVALLTDIPSTTAGGDLVGTFPNPTLSVAKQAELSGKASGIPKALQALGSTIKVEPLYMSAGNIGNGFALTDGQVFFVATRYVDDTTTFTGAKWFQTTAGNYTADNYNGIGLYSYAAGTLTLVASTTNDAAIWTQTTATWGTKAFSAPYVAAPGIYFIGLLYNSSAQTTAPALGIGTSFVNAAITSLDFTNSAKMAGTLATQATMPASVVSTSIVATTAARYAALY
jgi:hypothetical protein